MISYVRENKTLVILTCIALFILVSLVKATTTGKKFKKNFQEEMAQRLDLEEKMDKMDKDRSKLLNDLKNLQDELKRDRDALGQVQSELSLEQKKRLSLEESLSKDRSDQKTSVSGANQGNVSP